MAIRYACLTLIAVGALYLTIWPHELGHSIFAYLYGCKANWWQTDTSWFLWGSQGGAVDYDCLSRRGRIALGMTDFGGIAVNLILLALAPLVGRWQRKDFATGESRWPWWFLATFIWALANYAEAFSYLVLNTLWLKSDMRTVVTASGINRWIWLGAGVVGATLVTRWMMGPARRAADVLAAQRGSRGAWLRRFAVYVAVVSIVMAAGRIVLT